MKKILDVLYKTFCVVVAFFPFYFAIMSLIFHYQDTYELFSSPLISILLFSGFGILVLLIDYVRKRKIRKKIIYNILFGICISTCIFQIIYYNNYNVKIISIFFLLVFSSMCIGTWLNAKLNERYSTFVLPAFCVVLTGLIRIIVINILDNQPVSDFLRVYNYAILDKMDYTSQAFLDFKSNAIFSPYYGIESITMRFILKIIGSSVFKAQIINVAMACTVSLLIYKIGLLIFKEKKLSFIVSLIYAFYPSAILQDNFFAHENYYIFFNTIFLYYFIKFLEEKTEKKGNIIKLVVSGIFLGISNLYKPIGIIYLGAMIVLAVFRILDNLKNKRYYIKVLLKEFLIVFIFYMLISKLGTMMLESYIDSETFATPYKSILFGLTTNPGNGQWSESTNEINNLFIKESLSIEDYNKKVVNYVCNDWKNNFNKVPKLLATKFALCWGGEDGYCYWATQGLSNSMRNFFSCYSSGVVAIIILYSIIIYGLCMLSMTNAIFKKNESIIFMGAVVLLFTVMLMLTEAQARYKSIIFVPLCILAGTGIDVIKKIKKNRCNDIK